jgi:hypothetical protein
MQIRELWRIENFKVTDKPPQLDPLLAYIYVRLCVRCFSLSTTFCTCAQKESWSVSGRNLAHVTQWLHTESSGSSLPCQQKDDLERPTTCSPLLTTQQQSFYGPYACVPFWIVKFGNDPSAGSPTETLLRLLLPLSDQVWSSFQHSNTTRKPYWRPVRRPH